MATHFISPADVTAPARRWSLISILFDPKTEKDCPLALGRWDNRSVLAMRWNGSKEHPIGSPQSRGLPTWFVLPERYYDAVIATLTPEMQTLARNFLPNA